MPERRAAIQPLRGALKRRAAFPICSETRPPYVLIRFLHRSRWSRARSAAGRNARAARAFLPLPAVRCPARVPRPLASAAFRALLFLIAGALSFAVPGIAAAQVPRTIQLSSSRESLRADGYSRAVIIAEVRDNGGGLVPDGTEVRFFTTLGTIDPIGVTSAGVARVNLTSAAVEGFASVTASAGSGAHREMSIPFLAEGRKGPERARVIPIEAGYIGYSSDYGIIDAVGRVTAQIGSMTILADHLQLNAGETRLVAESAPDSLGLTLTDGDTSWIARRVTYDWNTLSGLVETDDETFEYGGPPLMRKSTAAEPSPDAFRMSDLDDTMMWITAKRVALFPRQRIHFQGMTLRPNGRKVLALPYHSMPIGAAAGTAEQFVGIGTQGLTLDLPYYLRLTDGAATSLRLGWNKVEGTYGSIRPGFGLDLRHRMFVGETGEETVNLTRFTSRDWGAWYRHSRVWSPGLQTSAYVEYPAHRDLFAAGNAYWQTKRLSGAVNLTTTRIRGFDPTTLVDASVETRPVRLGSSGWRGSLISSTGLSSGTGRSEVRQALMGRLTMPSVRWGKRTSASATATLGQVLTGSRKGMTADAVVSASHSFAPMVRLGMNYSYHRRPGTAATTLQAGRHRIGAQLLAATDRAQFYTTLSYGLDGRSTSMVNDLRYAIRPRGRLELGLRNTYFSYAGQPFTDQEISLTTPVFERPLTLFWSRRRHRFVLEFGQFGF